MRIRERVAIQRIRDIGKLDNTLDLPMKSRLHAGLKTVCDACGKSITGERFVVGFKKGHRNMTFHPECLEEGGPCKNQ